MVHTSVPDDQQPNSQPGYLPKFGRLPTSIRNDRLLPAEALVVLAFRSMFAGRFKLHPNLVRQFIAAKPCFRNRPVESPFVHRPGMGIKAFYGAMRTCKDREYIRHAKGGRAITEELTFPQTHNMPQVQMAWFEARLSLNALAVLIWIDVNPNSFSREVAERFGWGQQTATWALRELNEAGYVVAIPQARNAKGQFGAQRYCTKRYVEHRDSVSSVDEHDLHFSEPQDHNAASGFTADDIAVHGFEPDILRDFPSQRDSLDADTKPIDSIHTAFADAKTDRIEKDQDRLNGGRDEIERRIWSWLDDEDEFCHRDCYGQTGYRELADQVQYSIVERVTNCIPLNAILRSVRHCSSGRVHPSINNVELAKGVAFIAAGILVHEENAVADPARAVQIVLNCIRTEVGLKKGNCISNLGMIGKRVFLKNHRDEFAADSHALSDPALQIRRLVIQCDAYGVLFQRLSSAEDYHAVHELFEAHGVEKVCTTVENWLIRLQRECDRSTLHFNLRSWQQLLQECPPE